MTNPDNYDHPDDVMHESAVASWAMSLMLSIAKHGHQVIGVFDTQPGFAYTIGLSTKLGYEMIVFGLPPNVAATMLNSIADKMDFGAKIQMDVPDDRWANLPVKFKVAGEDARGYVCQADRYYGQSVKVVQVVLPDASGKFPGDEGFDTEYMNSRQVIL